MAEILRMKEGPAVDPSEGWEGVPVGEPIPLRPLPEAPEDDDFPPAAVVARVVSGFPEAEPPRRRPGLRLLRRADLEARAPRWLVRGLLEQDSLLCLYGEPGHGKSFVSVDLACSVATGRDFHGQKVRRGPVVLIAGEGRSGLLRRVAAWELHHGVCASDLFVSPARLP